MHSPTPTRRRNQPAQKPAKAGTPIRNSLLLVLFALCLVMLVILLPKNAPTPSATVLAPGGMSVTPTGEAETISLTITEVMASNKQSFPDDHGQFPDWLEVTNTGKERVHLKDIGLSDKPTTILFLFPDIWLSPGQSVTVFCDNTNASAVGAPLHARFQIAAAGDTLYLFDRGAHILCSLSVPALPQDISYAFAANEWILTDMATPAYPNTREGYEALHQETIAAGNGLILNELCASSRTTIADEDNEYSDWIELYNGSNHAIDLANYALSDKIDNRVLWRFPQGAVIQPHEYYVVFASGKDRKGGNGRIPHTNFSLAADSETVLLSDIFGTLLDQVTYDNLSTDASWGRVEGLSTVWQEYLQPTPGLPNNRKGMLEMDRRMVAKNTSGIIISEIVTNTTGLETPFGVTSYDWVEIANIGTTAVNINRWGLSDEVNRPRQWQFPDITLAPGDHKLVFLSGLTGAPRGSSALHAPFRLNALGEALVLSDPQGNIVDKLVIPRLETNTSFGRDTKNGGFFYFGTPTPGAANAGLRFEGYAAQPTIVEPGGYRKEGATVTLLAPDGVQIRYTLDGSDPTETMGLDYTGMPITLSKTCVVRARGFAENLKPSVVSTATYLFNAYHILPVVCLTTDPDNLWNPLTGIYADGIDETFEKVPFKLATYRVVKKDPLLREREAYFEYILPDATSAVLGQRVDIMLHGQFSLDIAQKSFRVTARSRYGEDTLRYPFFSDRPFTSYPALILRNGGNDGSYSRIVDVLQSRIVDWTGSPILHMAGTPVILYLNGEYWGQYDLRERINPAYVAMADGLLSENMDFIKGNSEVKAGSFSNYQELLNFVRNNDLNAPANLEKVLAWIDLDNYFDFMIFEIYFGNSDTLNVKFYRPRVPDGQWRWVLFDLDWGYWTSVNKGFNLWLNESGSGVMKGTNVLIRKLLLVPALREKFLTRFGDLYQNYFTDIDRIQQEIDRMVKAVEPEMPMHFNRWAGQTSKIVAFDPPAAPEAAYRYWLSRVDRVRNTTVPNRPQNVWTECQEWFKLTDGEMERYFGEMPGVP